MTIENNIPHYNLGYVTRETNIHPDTLRAWERRYGLPNPQRSEGGHRLYTKRDIDIIRWLMQQQNNGLSISKAVSLLKELVADGHDPLAAAKAPLQTVDMQTSDISGLRKEWIDAIREYDNAQADLVLSRAFANYTIKIVLEEILHKGLVEIGEQWFRGKITIQQEHFATAHAIRLLYMLISSAPPPNRPNKIIIGLPSGEEHEVAPLMLNLMLRFAGWDVVYLGANVPIIQLETTLRQTNPELVIFGAYMLPTAAKLLEVASFMNAQNIPLAFGGPIFNRLPQLRERIPGFFIGEDIESAIKSINTITQQNPPPPSVQPVPLEFQKVLPVYHANLTGIDASMQKKLRNSDINISALICYNNYFAEYISAALSLGNLHYISQDLEWVKHLISHHNVYPTALPLYLEAYREALNEVMGDSGLLISDWLSEEILHFK